MSSTPLCSVEALAHLHPHSNHPNPGCQFIVGFGQWSWRGSFPVDLFDQKFHACSVLGWQLVPLEVNYNVGNRELIAVVLTQQEWRQWLEGFSHLIIVWTDHKHICYLRNSKCF